MQSDPMFFVVVASVILVLVILAFGLITFTRGGAFNRKYSNKIMRARIAAQLVAVILIVLFVYFSRQGG